MSIVCGPNSQWKIIDLPGPDPDSGKNFALIATLLDFAIADYMQMENR